LDLVSDEVQMYPQRKINYVIKHWHGGTETNAMSHIAVTYIKDGKNADWMELVTDEDYAAR
ncbi:hypothetical protein EON81_28715, partial [bacterium]